MKSALLLLGVTFFAASPLCPQGPVANAPQPDDPPARIGRLNWLSGDVSFQPAGLEDWGTATLNYPLTTSDHLFTGKDSRAEIHVGANAIRLDANSNFGFLNLDDSIVQVSLTDGSMEIHLRLLDEDDSFEVATPNGAITLLRTGDYRIDTDPDRDATMLTVRAGQAELFSGANSVIIRAQETAYFQTDQNPDVRTANAMDDFDSFAASRDDNVPISADAGNTPVKGPRGMDRFSDYVSVPDLIAEGMTGAEDLASYGSWQNTVVNGDVWVPPVDSDWAPYSDGDWSYVEPYGWTWIDAAPWGFAPFHYGRWAYQFNRWVWVPGPRVSRQVYAPAVVSFIGGGAVGTVSWFPLGPRDTWTPPWRTPPDPLLPTRISMNRNMPGAIRTLSQYDFVAGTKVRPTVGLVSDGQPIGSFPLVMPMQDSLLGGTSRIHPPGLHRPLIARTAPPLPPILFAAQLGLLAQNQGRPLAPKQIEYMRRQLPATVMPRPAVRSTVPLVRTPRVERPAPARPQGRSNAGPPGRSGQ